MRILILNWKDIKHPQSGGAEIVTHQFALHLNRLGHTVTLFTTHPKTLPAKELYEGIQIVRKGNAFTVFFHAFFFYRKYKKSFDIIIDQIHGIPFFTPLYVRKPVLAWIHEIAGPIWFYEFSFVLALLGRALEYVTFLIYKNVHFLTDSLSTKQELIANNIPSKNISIIPLTITKPKIKLMKKSLTPQLIYVGRLNPMKRVEILLRTHYLLSKRIPEISTIIVGRGKKEYVKDLKNIVKNSQLERVHFLHFLQEKEKYNLLGRAWLHIHPSLKEGFGLTVLEASAVGTPTIAFTISGLKDQIRSGINGELVNHQTPEALALKIIDLLQNRKQLNELSNKSFKWAMSLPTWQDQTKKLEKLLKSLTKDMV